jgi:hypothetical protein
VQDSNQTIIIAAMTEIPEETIIQGPINLMVMDQASLMYSQPAVRGLQGEFGLKDHKGNSS